MDRETFDRAVAVFQNGYESDYEYGISDEDAQNGLIAAYRLAGVDVDDVAAALKAERGVESAEVERRRKAAWDALSPTEQRIKREMDASFLSLSRRVLDNFLKPSSLLAALCGPHGNDEVLPVDIQPQSTSDEPPAS